MSLDAAQEANTRADYNSLTTWFPDALRARLERLAGDPAGSLEVAVESMTEQAGERLRAGCPGLHFYTLNQSPATRAIFERLRDQGLLPHPGA